MNEDKESSMYLFSPLFFPLLCLLQPKSQKLAASPLRFCCLPDYFTYFREGRLVLFLWISDYLRTFPVVSEFLGIR